MNNAQLIMSGFSLDDLDAADERITFDVAVKEDLDGNPICGFKIVGKNSPEAITASNAIRIANIKRASKRSKQIDSATDEGAAAISRTVELNDRSLAMAITVDWFGFTLEGAPMPFDRSRVEKLFDKYPTWQTKVLNALEVDSNFTKV